MLIHDESLKRTTGLNKLVKDVSYEELASLDAGSWYHPDFSNERIPALEQLLELTQNKGTILNLELKNGVVPYPGIEEEVIRTVRTYGMENKVILSSFNHYSLALCKELAPEIKTGILYMEGLYKPWEYAASLNADALHAYKYAVLPEWVAEAAACGIVYHPFTANEEAELEKLLDCGVAGIITDYPDRLVSLLKRKGAAAQ